MYKCSFVSSAGTTQYLIINGSCPVSAGQTQIITATSSDNLNSYFSFYPAQFAGSSSGLQVSCSALLCRSGDISGNCASGSCTTPQHFGARRRRRDASSQTQTSLADFVSKEFATSSARIYLIESTSAGGFFTYDGGQWVYKLANSSAIVISSSVAIVTSAGQQSTAVAMIASQNATVQSGKLLPLDPSFYVSLITFCSVVLLIT